MTQMISTMAKMDVQSDLAAERTKATFDTENLTFFIYGGRDNVKRKRFLENLAVQDPHFKKYKPWAFCSSEEKYDMALGKHMYIDKKLTEMGITDPKEVHLYRECAASCEPNPLGVHYGMFITTIEKQGTLEQKERWLPLIKSKKMFGTYAQTELGHGTFIRRLETTATYDPVTQEFILDSPTLTSMKFWPGGLGLSSNHCLVAAQLYTQGQCHGLHMFMVQLRSMEDHSPLPGIDVGVIGPNFGFNTTDNGFLRLNQVRIPRENMLMKFSQVLKDGTFVKPKYSKMTYGTMVYVRVMIVHDVASALSKACVIAIRYSAVRRQTEIKPGSEEQLILNYQTQQFRLLPLLASAFCLSVTGNKIYGRYLEINNQLEQGNTEDLAELHALSSGLKAFSSYVCCSGIETCRLCCGGHGYSHASGLPKIYQNISAACTYEGENTVLLLQTARYLMKCYSNAGQVKSLPLFVQYLKQRMEAKSCMTEEVSLDCILKAYEHRAARLVGVAARSMQTLRQSGKPQHEAWNGSSVQLIWAANAHCHLFTMKTFMEAIRSPTLEPKTAGVMQSLCQLYGVHGILENLGDFIQDGFLSGPQVNYLQRKMWTLFEEIRPNAVALADAFDFTDMTLDSCLGRYDGQVYQALYDYAKSAPMNQEQIHSSYYKHLKPMMHPDSGSRDMKYAKL